MGSFRGVFAFVFNVSVYLFVCKKCENVFKLPHVSVNRVVLTFTGSFCPGTVHQISTKLTSAKRRIDFRCHAWLSGGRPRPRQDDSCRLKVAGASRCVQVHLNNISQLKMHFSVFHMNFSCVRGSCRSSPRLVGSSEVLFSPLASLGGAAGHCCQGNGRYY